MYYVTYGKPNNISNELMDRAVAFAADFLEIDEVLEIDFEDEYENGCCGSCDYETNEVTIRINPNMKKSQILTTLFHEMVHVKQYVKNELVSGVGKSPSRWMGKECNLPYYETPWEVEAFELEAVMWDIFKQDGLWLKQ